MAHPPYGYSIKNGKAVIDDNKALQVRRLFTEYVGGMSLQAAGDKLGIKRRHTSLGRMLADKRYLGDDFYPVIIKELWNKAQDERRRRAEALGRNKNYFADDKTEISPFEGKIFCNECGSEYRRYQDDGKERWRCRRRIVKGRLCCNSPMIPETVLETSFMEIIRTLDIAALKEKPPAPRIQIEQRFADPFKQAEYVYSQVTVDDFEYQTEKLLAALQKTPDKIDGEMMRQVIMRITVSHSGAAEFEFINGIPVFFEKENINTLDSKGEILLTIMASLAQQESLSLSQNVKMGFAFRFQNGELQNAITKAINLVIADRDGFMATLKQNIETVLSVEYDKETGDIDAKLNELQEELLRLAHSKADYEKVADEIYRLREIKQNTMVHNAERQNRRQRIAEMNEFLRGQSGVVTEAGQAACGEGNGI